jgi:hypothetical protein
LIDLKNSNLNVHKTWKRLLKESLKNNLKFEYIADPTFEQVSFFCKMFDELSRNKGLTFQLEPKSLSILLKNKDFKLFYVYNEKDEPLLAQIVYVYKNTSYEIYVANSTASRYVRGSSYFMMNSILDWLKENGVEFFDFGKIGPGKRSDNGVFEFKSRLGGEKVTYNGEWIYSTNKFLESVVYFLLNLRINRY